MRLTFHEAKKHFLTVCLIGAMGGTVYGVAKAGRAVKAFLERKELSLHNEMTDFLDHKQRRAESDRIAYTERSTR